MLTPGCGVVLDCSYLIVMIPDLCPLSYLENDKNIPVILKFHFKDKFNL